MKRAQRAPNALCAQGGVGTQGNNTAESEDMCSESWVDLTSEAYGWASTNSGIVNLPNATSHFMSPGTVTGSTQIQLQRQLARLECPVEGFEPQSTQQTVCAYPTNFQQTSGQDAGGGTLQFTYTWASSTGKLSDLAAYEGASVAWVVEIAPRDTYTETLVLDQWFLFPEIGNYRIKVHLVRVQGFKEELPDDFGSWSALPSVDVLPRDPARLIALCEELKAKLETSNVYAELGEAGLELSYVDDPIAVPYLQEMALLKYGVLAGSAAEGLERVGGDAGVEALIALSKESQVEIKSPARYSLWKLGQTTKDPALKERIREALEEQQN